MYFIYEALIENYELQINIMKNLFICIFFKRYCVGFIILWENILVSIKQLMILKFKIDPLEKLSSQDE